MKKQLYLFLNSIIFCSAIGADPLSTNLSAPTPTLTSTASNHFPNASLRLTYQGDDGHMCERLLTTADRAIQMVAPRTAAYASDALNWFGKNMNIGIAIGAVATICIFLIASRLWRVPLIEVKPTININPEEQKNQLMSIKKDPYYQRNRKNANLQQTQNDPAPEQGYENT